MNKEYLISDVSDFSIAELKLGYIEQDEAYVCLCCGQRVEKGVVYPEGGILYESERYVRLHIQKEHQSVFHYLLHLDKTVTGLSDVQKNILALFYEGKTDPQVQVALGIGSTSTIRNHRFQLKEKERQARVFLALMELLKERGKQGANFQPSKSRVDSKLMEDEQEKIIKKYFPAGPEGRLASFPMKEKVRRVVLNVIAGKFEAGRRYSEREVNEILEFVFEEHVVLRRYLVEYGFLNRVRDGSQYWVTDMVKRGDEENVNRRQELQQEWKEQKTVAGVFQIKNLRNQKIFVESTPNIKAINGQKFQLENQGHRNKVLQGEWNEFGAEAFTFEVLEELEKKSEEYYDLKDALKKLKEKWVQKLQPFGDRGYNSVKNR